MSERVRVESEGDVLVITITRPALRNALDETSIEELTRALEGPASAPSIRFVVLRGEGKVFCAGADIDYMRRLAAADTRTNLDDAGRLGRLFAAIASCPHPVIAAVQGAAIGGGIGLLAAADIALATTDAKFGFTEVRLGIVPAVISPYAIRRLGGARARRLFLTGEIFDAETALRFGLVDELAPPDSLDPLVETWIDRLRVGGPAAQTAVKRLLEDVMDLPLAEAVERTPGHIAAQRATAEASEGFAAFFDRRPPAWMPSPESDSESGEES